MQQWVKADKEKKEKQAKTLANRVAKAKERAMSFKPKKYVRSEPKQEPEEEKLLTVRPHRTLHKRRNPPTVRIHRTLHQDPDSHNISYTPLDQWLRLSSTPTLGYVA